MSSSSQDRSLLALILDVTPSAWGERELKRNASDKARAATGKSGSKGPAKLDEVLSASLAFSLAFSNLNRENCVVVIGVAGDEVAVVYPRKGGEMSLRNMVHDPSEIGGKVDARRLHDGLKLGVAELVARAAAKAERAVEESRAAAGEEGSVPTTTAVSKGDGGAAIASGISVALCVINRFMVASHGGVSAIASESLLKRREDEGVLAMIEGKKARKAAEEREERRRARGMPSPRILVVQASDDRTRDYNAVMNCAFASIKGDVTIDGCFIPSGMPGKAKTSTFLEQACDRTGGVFLGVPMGAAQVGGALTEVMTTVFLPPLSARKKMHLPALTKVDFRARCFESGECVDVANVCNQCLSIFKNKPKDYCPTCGAEVARGGEPSARKRQHLG